VARTDADGVVLNRTRYEPYGATAAGKAGTIGFTGHVNDSDTGLVYMQQRYYDPTAARFLSIDPVVTDATTGNSFNRYAYSSNNPYKYIDPDGREPLFPLITQERAASAAQYWADRQVATGNVLCAIPGAAVALFADHGEVIIAAVGAIKGGAKGSMGGPRAGKPHTQAAKRLSLENNKVANGGKAICPTYTRRCKLTRLQEQRFKIKWPSS
jgi:RHS repeat-associated protein